MPLDHNYTSNAETEAPNHSLLNRYRFDFYSATQDIQGLIEIENSKDPFVRREDPLAILIGGDAARNQVEQLHD